jgi:CubicO group peptidase (beta-lactamase class C family)
MKRTLGALILLFAALQASVVSAQTLAPAKPDDVGLSSERLGKIEQVFNHNIEAGQIPGLVVMIARRGKLAYSQSFGLQDRQKSTPMSTDAIFRAYSMTKPLVAVGAMILAEDGRLQLTDPVSKWLPEFQSLQVSVPSSDPLGQPAFRLTTAERQPTVQDLLRHTGGLAYGEITGNKLVKEAYAKAGLYKSDFDYNATDLTPQEEVERLAKAPLAYQPGSVWEYSMAIDLLGRVVEKVSGQRLGEFLNDRLFRPLGMADTAFYVPQEKLARLAEPLAKDPATGNPIRLIDVSAPPKNDSGGAGSVTTAADYLRFAQMLLDGGRLDGTRILSRPSVALMISDQLGDRIRRTAEPGELLLGVQGYTFGLSFAVRLQPGLAGVPGSQGQFTWAGYAGTFFWVDPKEQLAVVMMMQAPGPNRAFFRRQIMQLVYQAIVD